MKAIRNGYAGARSLALYALKATSDHSGAIELVVRSAVA